MGLREKKSIISFVLISYLQIKHRQIMNEESSRSKYFKLWNILRFLWNKKIPPMSLCWDFLLPHQYMMIDIVVSTKSESDVTFCLY